MFVPAYSAWVCWFPGVVEITPLNTSKFYYLDELCRKEFGFVLSFVSSNNTDVEMAEQFILLRTRYLGDFFSLTNFSFSETLICRLKENIYIINLS